MPEIDPDLFQTITLGLLLLAVILLLATFATLSRIRKLLEEGGFAAEVATTTVDALPAQSVAATPAAATQAAPAQAQPVQAEPAAETAPAAVTQPAAAAPASDQPFEKDGRWWFQRGDELLVYDEKAQQWVPAPADATVTAPAAAAAPAASPYVGEAAATTQEGGGFWKCPSCGAVNGSTAASCRMCFAARP